MASMAPKEENRPLRSEREFRNMLHLAYEYCLARAYTEPRPLPEFVASAADWSTNPFWEVELRTKLLGALEALTERDRGILAMKVFEEASLDEIAERFPGVLGGCSRENARRAVDRALRRVLGLLMDRGFEYP